MHDHRPGPLLGTIAGHPATTNSGNVWKQRRAIIEVPVGNGECKQWERQSSGNLPPNRSFKTGCRASSAFFRLTMAEIAAKRPSKAKCAPVQHNRFTENQQSPLQIQSRKGLSMFCQKILPISILIVLSRPSMSIGVRVELSPSSIIFSCAVRIIEIISLWLGKIVLLGRTGALRPWQTLRQSVCIVHQVLCLEVFVPQRLPRFQLVVEVLPLPTLCCYPPSCRW